MLRRFVSVLRQSSQSHAAAGAAAVKKDGYLTLNFATPNDVISNNVPVHMVEVSTATGDMGILAEHAAYLAELKPGVVSVFEEKDGAAKKFFVPGGFLTINENSQASLTCSEAIPLDELDVASAKHSLEQFNADLNKAKDDAERTDARIGVDVFTAMVAALESSKK